MNDKTYKSYRCTLKSLFLATTCLALSGQGLRAQSVVQPVVLEPGWNATYLAVESSLTADELLAGWPVKSVSVYRPAEMLGTEQISGGLSGEYTVQAPFGVWTREAPEASTLRFLPADSVLVCYNDSGSTFSTNVEGKPVAPRISWRVSRPDEMIYNYLGVRLTGEIPASDYFAGAEIIPPILKLGGQAEETPTLYNPQRGSLPWKLKDGEALLVRTGKGSDWSGPLHVAPRRGIDFGTEDQRALLEIRNDGTAAKTVRLVDRNAAGDLVRPALLWLDQSETFSTNKWAGLPASQTKTLSTGEVWRVGLAIDRRQFPASAAGKRFGGIFEITEEGGTRMKVQVPYSVDVGEVPEGGKVPSGTWPAGLWEGTVELDKVTLWTKDGRLVDGMKAGGRMRLRILVHVDDDGEAVLLQRVLLASTKAGEGRQEQKLFRPGATIPAEYGAVTRISTAALPTGLGVLPSKAGAFLGGHEQPLVFSYAIGEDDPSNPFYHPHHPHFDGLQGDFKLPAPSGADFQNYIGAIKPERFPIGGEIRLVFDDTPETPWDPSETTTGSVRWTYTGVRREGPLHADGTFVLSRISRIGHITR